MEFRICGHENTLSAHKTTLEFTKDAHLTKKGDCILGVKADFSLSELQRLQSKKRFQKILVSIATQRPNPTEELSGYLNNKFSSDHEIVLRKSDFLDSRTFLIRTNKAAIDIDRRLVHQLADPKKKATVTLDRLTIRNIVFDFDNTLEDWQQYEDEADKLLAGWVFAKLKEKGRNPPKMTEKGFAKIFRESKAKFILHYKAPRYYGRDYWLRDALKTVGTRFSKEEIDALVRRYWDHIDANVKLFPQTRKVLSKLSKKYNLYILSDSDGSKQIKMRRIRKFHIAKYFKKIVTSDDTGYNKPDMKGEKIFLKSNGINPHESVFVGDHPETDLSTSKRFGMSTVWIRKGEYADDKRTYPYIDFTIDEIEELLDILKEL